MDESIESNEPNRLGLFIDNLDWNDPRFAPYNIASLGELNDAQKDALMDDDEEQFFGPDEFTEDELKEICLTLDCRVDLGSTSVNVCTGVERGWPNRMFGEPDFKKLQPKQQRAIYRSMERKAVHLHNIYFHEDRFKRKKENRTRNAMAWYYELRFRRNLFNHIKALGDGEQRTNNNDNTIGSASANFNDNSIDDLYMNDHTLESMTSLETVINTGRTQSTQQSPNSPSKTDENDNEFVDASAAGIGENNENDANAENVNETVPKRKPGRPRVNLSTHEQSNVPNNVLQSRQETVIVLIDSDTEEEVEVDEESRYADMLTESMTASQSTLASNYGSDSDRRSLVCATPNISSQEFVSQSTMSPFALWNRDHPLFGGDDDDYSNDGDPAELDFLKDNMLSARTSTQQ